MVLDKSMKISEKTHKRLNKLGKKKESYDEIVNRKLDEIEELKKEIRRMRK